MGIEGELENGLIVGHAYSVTGARAVRIGFRKIIPDKQCSNIVKQAPVINVRHSKRFIAALWHQHEPISSILPKSRLQCIYNEHDCWTC